MTRPGGFTDELRVQAGGSGRVEISGKQSDMFSLPLTGCPCGHPRPSALRQSHTSRHEEPLSMAICTEVAVWHMLGPRASALWAGIEFRDRSLLWSWVKGSAE